jgi:hypothetical protein
MVLLFTGWTEGFLQRIKICEQAMVVHGRADPGDIVIENARPTAC